MHPDSGLLVGGRDPQHVTLHSVFSAWCGVHIRGGFGFICSRPPGHAGRHVASNDRDGIVDIEEHFDPNMQLPEGF